MRLCELTLLPASSHSLSCFFQLFRDCSPADTRAPSELLVVVIWASPLCPLTSHDLKLGGVARHTGAPFRYRCAATPPLEGLKSILSIVANHLRPLKNHIVRLAVVKIGWMKRACAAHEAPQAIGLAIGQIITSNGRASWCRARRTCSITRTT